MKRSDVYALSITGILLAFFLFCPGILPGFISLTKAYPFLMSFIKFAILATFGECIGLRISQGVYNRPGFGVLPKAVVWGFLGVGIKAAFTIFVVGTPALLFETGFTALADQQVVRALAISTGLNCIFAPVFMTLHKITDMHIAEHGGTLSCLLKPLDMAKHLQTLNWQVMWNFVFKKTLPLFWIPCHTITFLLPGEWQVLFAAALGIALGIILAVANLKKSAA